MAIHNPSYATRPEMWHAVAMQQQRLSGLNLALAPSRRAPMARSASRLAPTPAPARAADEEDYDDDGLPAAPLTLAQRMGLAEAPEPELASSEWDAIAECSRDRGGSRQPCSICLQHFRGDAQVLLSCSHTFHRACLRSWECYSKSRCCPVCRKLHYRKRAICDGANLYRDECATALQAGWRGARVRAEFGPKLRHANPERMRSYCEYRLSSLTDQLVGHLDAQHDALDALFAEIDSSVASARLALDTPDWPKIEAAARERGPADCPVCLAPMGFGSDALTLLSCTHVFHRKCLESFERFNVKADCSCPVCRVPYSKVALPATGDGAPAPLSCAPCEPAVSAQGLTTLQPPACAPAAERRTAAARGGAGGTGKADSRGGQRSGCGRRSSGRTARGRHGGAGGAGLGAGGR